MVRMEVQIICALLVICFPLAECRIVEDIRNCNKPFFYKNTPPVGFPSTSMGEYRPICQDFRHRDFFATMYNTTGRIPLYSAYSHEGTGKRKRGGQRNFPWRIESGLNITLQAGNDDYRVRPPAYDKGHLYPRSYCEELYAAPTFTLTNAVPQVPRFNRRTWKAQEQMYRKLYCDGTKYFITGAIPGTTKLNGRVTIPTHMWTALCCTDRNGEGNFTRACIAENKQTASITNLAISNLQQQLIALYKKADIQIFKDNCEKKKPQHITTTPMPITTLITYITTYIKTQNTKIPERKLCSKRKSDEYPEGVPPSKMCKLNSPDHL